jgi:hypothetical protein
MHLGLHIAMQTVAKFIDRHSLHGSVVEVDVTAFPLVDRA